MAQSDRVRVGVLALSGAVIVVILVFGAVRPVVGMEAGWPWAIGFTAFPVAAALLLAKRRGHVIGRLLGLVGLSGGAVFALAWIAVHLEPQLLSALAETAAGGVIVVLISSLIAVLLLFPTGRPLPGIHRRVLVVFVVTAGIALIAMVVRPGPMPVTGRPNPLAVAETLGPLIEFMQFQQPAFLAVGVWTLLVRRRRAGPRERMQLRWLFAAAFLVLGMMIVTGLVPQGLGGAWEVAVGVVVIVGFWSVPAAIVVAITRYRLYEIDRIVSRTASYTVVAVILGLVYLGSIIGLQALLPTGGSDLAVAGSTLAAVAVFAPVRRRVSRAVDRRFDRERYEAERVISAFVHGLREEIDHDALTSGIVEVAVRTMRPSSAHFWPVRLSERHGTADPPS